MVAAVAMAAVGVVEVRGEVAMVVAMVVEVAMAVVAAGNLVAG